MARNSLVVPARIWGPLSDMANRIGCWSPSSLSSPRRARSAWRASTTGPQALGVEGLCEDDLYLGGGLLGGDEGGEPFAGDDVEDGVGDPGEWREGTSPSRSLRTVRDSLPSYGSHSPAFFCLGQSVGSSPEGLTSTRP